jgi:NTE family protein
MNAAMGITDSQGATGSWWDATRNWLRNGISRTQGAPRIGLALGGGFARGIAHVGVLRAFEKNDIPIHAVAGVSAGSMVAAAMAGGADSKHIEEIALSMKLRDVARWTISRHGLAGSDRMISFLGRLLKATRFEDMKLPLAVVATDLNAGKPVIFEGKGDVILPIRASCSYPGLYMPIRDGRRCLVDGFVSMEVPVLPLRQMGCTHIIAVHLPSPEDCPDFGNMLAVVNRCFQVMSTRTEGEWRRFAKIVIAPDVRTLAWDSFASAKGLIDSGEKAALAAIPAIQRWLGSRSPALQLTPETVRVAS